MLRGKTVLLGVSGGIAAYKIAGLASRLVKCHADVHVLMTENATHFINPITFETLTGNKCLIDTFDRNFEFQVEHVSIAKKADILLVAPATANMIGKLANGIADDMLTTTALACKCRKLISPAMNTNMYENEIVQDNLNKLRKYGMEVIEPEKGRLACGDTGAGKMPDETVLFDYIAKEIRYEKDMLGKKVLVTAGATREAIDPVRFITNHSTGKMGCAIARCAMERGAQVTLIAGSLSVEVPPFVKVIRVESAGEMFEAVKAEKTGQDIIVKVAAVADFTPKNSSSEKIKKKDDNIVLELTKTTDILKYLGETKEENQFLCGFSMETENMLENSKEKLHKKNLDMIVANNLKDEGAGFGTDTNHVTLITKERVRELELMSKEKVAEEILTAIMSSFGASDV